MKNVLKVCMVLGIIALLVSFVKMTTLGGVTSLTANAWLRITNTLLLFGIAAALLEITKEKGK